MQKKAGVREKSNEKQREQTENGTWNLDMPFWGCSNLVNNIKRDAIDRFWDKEISGRRSDREWPFRLWRDLLVSH